MTLLTRALWIAYYPAYPIEPVDAEGFHLLAQNLLGGNGFAIAWEAPFCPTAIRTPLYPLFVAGGYSLLGVDPTRIILLHLLLETLTTALVIRLGTDLGGRRIGILAGLFYTLNGTTQRYTGYLLSETLLLPILITALWLTVRTLKTSLLAKWDRFTGSRQSAGLGHSAYASLAGFFWGLSLLVKPNMQFLALAVGILVTNYELRVTNCELRIANCELRIARRVSRLLPFWLALFFTLFPWLLRNRMLLDRWMLSTAFEENLARVSAVATLAEVEGISADPWTETWEYLYGQIVSQAAARYGWQPGQESREVEEQEKVWLPRLAISPFCEEARERQTQVATVARDVVVQHPREFVSSHLWGVSLSMLNLGHQFWYRVLTGQDWAATHTVDNIVVRIAWSLKRNAWGDALQALWQERIAHIPRQAALLWWGLLAARFAVWGLSLRGVWRVLKSRFLTNPRRLQTRLALLLTSTVAYILLLPGPIAYDRFYLPAIPVVVILLALGL
ncbi:MAG: glycosyltransferase family 39 protein [Anaerolineae bacterium]|nr:glycosyltransferase family 39 protein [Anaerolineae bacterium]